MVHILINNFWYFITGEKNHVCSSCSKAFADMRALNSHMTTHTGEKPFSCATCGKCFAHYSSLSSHRKTHIKESKIQVVNHY